MEGSGICKCLHLQGAAWFLINKDVATNDGAAGGVTVAQLDGEEVVGPGKTVVSYIDHETDLLLSGASGTGDVGMITSNHESCDAS